MGCGGQLLEGVLGEIVTGMVVVQVKIRLRKIAQCTKVQLSGAIGAAVSQGGIQRGFEGCSGNTGRDFGKCLNQPAIGIPNQPMFACQPQQAGQRNSR